MECPLRVMCYRYRATPSEYQSYSLFKPAKSGECEYFWDIRGYKHAIRTVADADKLNAKWDIKE